MIINNMQDLKAREFTLGLSWDSCCSIFRFLCCVLYIIVCTFSFGHCVVCSVREMSVLSDMTSKIWTRTDKIGILQ